MAEAGHAPNRVFIDQNGALNINGAPVYNDADVDISGTLETALGGSSAGMKFVGGTQTNSSGGVAAIATGLSGIVAASAQRLSTAAPSTAAGVPWWFTVGFTTNSGTLDVAAFKPTSTANVEWVAATSSGTSFTWGALGYV